MEEMINGMLNPIKKIIYRMKKKITNLGEEAFVYTLGDTLMCYIEDDINNDTLKKCVDKLCEEAKNLVNQELLLEAKRLVKESIHYKERLTGETFKSMYG